MTIAYTTAGENAGSTSAGSTFSAAFPGSGWFTGGAWCVLFVSTDNISTAEGETNDHTSLSAHGLTWEKLYEYTGSQGAAGDAATISAWLAQNTGSTIGTFSFSVGFSASVSNAQVRSGILSADNPITLDGAVGRAGYGAGALGSLSFSGLPSKARLFLRAVCIENPSLDDISATSGWTRISNTGRTGSSSNGLAWRGEFLLDTGTGATSTPTFPVSKDSVSILLALTDEAGGSTPVSFSGTIPTQSATEGTPFNVDLSTYFSGTETPFTYSVQSGALPAGLSLDTDTGEITGTPTTAGTASGIVIRATDGNSDTADSNSFSVVVAAADTTAPTLTSPTGTATGQTTASGTVDTDEANGTLYYLATTNSTESAATVKGGSSQAVTTTGEQSVGVTGLTAGTGYYLHYVQRDAAGNDSTVASSSLFTTDSIPVVKGVRIQLHDGATEQASLTGLTVAFFDDDDPATMGAPSYQSTTDVTDSAGWLEVDLDGSTALDIGDPGFLIVYKAGATAEDDAVFAGRVTIEDIG